MAAGFQQGGPTVAYPANVYPGKSFRGAGSRGGVGATGTSATAAIAGALPAGVRGQPILVLLIALGAAWVLWHKTSGR